MVSIPPQRLALRECFQRQLMEQPCWSTIDKKLQETYVRRMERNCLEVTIESCTIDGIDRLFTDKRFVERYSTLCNRILSNLTHDVVKGIIDQRIDTYRIATMTSAELCPEASAAEREAIAERKRQKQDVKVSRAYTCRKCLANSTIPLEFQAKAADETSSFSIKCTNCGHTWTMS